MKLAVITPIGDLNRFGYQYTADLCLQNQALLADRLWIVQSMPGGKGPAQLPRNAVYLDAPEFHFKDGTYSFEQVHWNRNAALLFAKRQGYDVALTLDCNWHIPIPAMQWIRGEAEMMVLKDQPWGWIYARYQFGHYLTGAAVRYPYLINLGAWNRWTYDARDGIRNELQAAEQVSERGNFTELNKWSVIDAGYELTISDLKDKLEFVRFYSDLMPKRPTSWEWEYWQDYYSKKVAAMPLAYDRPISSVYQAIARISDQHPDFLSRLIEVNA